MASIFLPVLLLAVVVSQGYALTLKETTLPEQTVNVISHPLYSRGITIPRWWFDTQLTCHVVYPNGITYQAYPTNNLPDEEVVYISATSTVDSCGVFFIHSERIEAFSGTYELKSLVQHTDESMTLTNQKFHVSFTVSEVGMPSNLVNVVESNNDM